jgi:hypothetical protein
MSILLAILGGAGSMFKGVWAFLGRLTPDQLLSIALGLLVAFLLWHNAHETKRAVKAEQTIASDKTVIAHISDDFTRTVAQVYRAIGLIDKQNAAIKSIAQAGVSASQAGQEAAQATIRRNASRVAQGRALLAHGATTGAQDATPDDVMKLGSL